MHIPVLISDLAVMMLTAGIITILFKRMKQPLILGYILAGFLTSPYFPLFMTVEDTEAIHTWSEIGIIFLMFHLGLEFNLHKLARVGGTAIITTIIEVAGMLAAGFGAGRLLGFNLMDSICLGGMLSMSSTTVIIKVFDELNLKGKKYTEMVFGTLVIQDIVGIFMMVILSTLAVSKNISGGQVAGSLALMVLYLIIWLILGIYLLPTFFNRAIRYMNDEMLLVVSIGICFGMVLLADWLGFSTALGAFLAGSLLAGTVHVERVENLTRGVKDLFGAVFFLSVGMMVDPAMIVKYAVPIVVIILVTLAGKLLFSTLGMLLSGQNMENSISAGLALAQIGEFAFIIANLGNKLGLISEFLYPIVVAVSVITTFTTPYCIKAAPFAVRFVESRLPEKMKTKLNRYTSAEQQEEEQDNDWYAYLRKYFFRITVYGGLMLVAAIAGIRGLQPFLAGCVPLFLSKILSCALIYFVMAVFVRPMLNLHNNLFTSLWLKQVSFHLPLLVLNMVKLVIITAIAMIPLRVFFNVHPVLLAVAVMLVLLFFSRSRFMATAYLQLETRFLRNFNERIIRQEEQAGRYQTWLDQQLFILSFIAPEDAGYLETPLESLSWGKVYNVYVVKIRHEGHQYILPAGNMEIHAGDKVFVAGEEKALQNFYALTRLPQTRPLRTLKEFMETDYPDVENALSVCAIKIYGDEDFAGKSIRQSQLRSRWDCLVLGVQRDGYPIIMPDPDLLLTRGDILWVMGSNNHVGQLAAKYVNLAE
ncbi:MAG: cation:proton antiporter [Firmicutes bacterium]|nr:cation:proton antiporter [Bacillota bacterium]MDY5857471.1 cation:proton antiporter [Anaerovoracaceae bacterium]